MDLLQNLQNMLGQSAPPANAAAGASESGGLGGLLSPSILGSLAGALFKNKAGASSGATADAGGGGLAAGALGGLLTSLLGGGGGDLFGKLAKEVLGGGGGDEPAAATPAPRPEYRQRNDAPPAMVAADKAIRLIRTMVYAAKADGHIDEKEEAAINQQVRQLNLGANVREMIQEVMKEPVDPERIASGISDPHDVLQVYALSCAICDPDQFMERNYLDALAAAMRLPPKVKTSIESRLRPQ